MIAGYYGKGKIFAFGHTTFKSDDKADNLKFARNIFEWLGGIKKKYKVGLLFYADSFS